jgi:hypothetical protein
LPIVDVVPHYPSAAGFVDCELCAFVGFHE